MAANHTGVPGALYDTLASNKLGGLNTLIGWGTNAVMGPPLTQGFDDADKVPSMHIGFGAPFTGAEAVGFAGQVLAIDVVTGADVAPGGALPDGSINRSGKTAPVGSAVIGVKPPVADADVADWYFRVLDAGGTISQATIDAMVAFATSAKASGYWSKFDRINLFCGDDLAGCLTPLKVGSGTPYDSNANFTAADYTENTGLRGNGSNKWLDTGVLGTVFTAGNRHLSAYERTRTTLSTKNLLGCESPTSSDPWKLGNTTQDIERAYGFQPVIVCDISGLTGTPGGHFLANQTVSGGTLTLYRNGLQGANNSTGTPGVPQAQNVGVFASNRGSARLGFTDVLMGGYSIGQAFTAAEVLAFYGHMHTFQSALSRAVGPPPADTDAVDWQTRVVGNSGTVSANTLNAVSAFVTSAKASGYWSKINRINLFAGDQLAAAKVPLKVGNGTALDTFVNHVGADYTEATGLGGGSPKYVNTGLKPSALTLNSTHFAVYSRGLDVNGAGWHGCWSASGLDAFALGAPSDSGGGMESHQYSNVTGQGYLSGAGGLSNYWGLCMGNRQAANNHALWKKGTKVASGTGSGGTLLALDIYVLATNNSGSSVNGYTAIPCGGYSIGAGLTDAQCTAFTTHMQTFQTALGRAVT
ncbi:hypothetical protein GCM10028796_46780 [Ramlibacter monticola]|uniref:Uncharacterized protein n=1 Tax=Ramlibacter monticola TaxID=1926872 RepID=A0A936Z3R9_9BURK|nr:hypothetical protein [Ramlibacter monticola]MBL0394303.1 hypothetical protein [Ramlibacter monticola]